MAVTPMIRVSDKTHRAVAGIAHDHGKTMQQVVAEAVDAYSRELMLRETNAAYAAVMGDESACSELMRERAEWDTTLADGLEGV
jgi:hypothetical protein